MSDQVLVNLPADPGIGGGIGDLGGGKVGFGPIGSLLFLGNPKTEEHAGERAQSGLLNLQPLGQGADLDKSTRLEFVHFPKLFQVVGDGDPGLENLLVFQDIEQGLNFLQQQNLDDKDSISGGELNQRGRIGDAPLKRGPGFRVESQEGFLAERFDTSRKLIGRMNQVGWTFIGADRQGIQLFFADAATFGYWRVFRHRSRISHAV